MKRREFIQKTGAAGVGLALSPILPRTALGDPAPAARPNILVFLTDDHAQWAQQAYGNSELQTPNMSKLAAAGTRMTNAFCTTPVCSPARASFFTGRMPSQHGIHDWLSSPTPPGLAGQTLISELLKGVGYHTALIGKWHCGEETPGAPQPGFDRWFSYWEEQYPHRGRQDFTDQGKEVTPTGQQSPFFTDQALAFLADHQQSATKDQPFFLFVSYTDTHKPHAQAPDDLVAQYQGATFKDIPVEPFAPCHGRPLWPPLKNPQAEENQKREYYASASAVDREVGRILDAVQAAGQTQNTLVVYAADHGLNCGQHGMWEKGNGTVPQNFLEESIRVPCTIAWPAGGVQAGATCDDFVNHCDLWATLLEAANAAPDASTAATINSPGRSYLPQLRGQKATGWPTTMIVEYGNARMAFDGRYKLIKRYPYGGVSFPDELYDLQTDPRETTNVFTDPAQAAPIATLTAELDTYFQKYTIAGHSGLEMENSPFHNAQSPWIRALKKGPAPAAATTT
jgi:arylsulfatase A-like enzyme